MTAPDPALAKALDHLSMQVNPNNVLAVHKVFHNQAKSLMNELLSLRGKTRVGLCGGDPVSKDASAAFGAKVDRLLEVHWAHQRELEVAAAHLKGIARDYGIAEDEITRSLDAERQPHT